MKTGMSRGQIRFLQENKESHDGNNGVKGTQWIKKKYSEKSEAV
jgi:hypothetical protein